MTNCNQAAFEFPVLNRRKVQAEFSGGEITSDGGALLLRQIDRRLGLMKAVDAVIPDPRNTDYITHTQLSLLRQRVYGLGLGYEDLNDHKTLRNDPALQTAVDREQELGSQSTLCRLEGRTGRKAAVDIHKVLIDQFIASFDAPPDELILDFDATDEPIHGSQEGRFFHGYYDHYCFLPLYVFCGDQLLVSYLRSSNIDGAKHAWAILALLTKGLRQEWPGVRIIFRGDSGFCRHRMLGWCERHDVKYIVGIARNKRLEHMIESAMQLVEQLVELTGEKQREFFRFQYAAKTWKHTRQVIAKLEITDKGRNPRFIITNLDGDKQALYDDLYCARGDMENRIKEQQMGLFADRTSAHYWWANQFRLLLSSLAYVLMEGIRRLALTGTELVRAQVGTIRLKLLKIGAVILRNTRRIRFLLSSAYPYQDLFALVIARLKPG
ncbi:MAG: IS1380 family transposase [Candidatus Thiodiazotropha sp. (ex Lucinoma borealis)]|nr:IS1380 family transposase [Candidatus Thiodiazotropha sp. (ex Lucinoma borealis)]